MEESNKAAGRGLQHKAANSGSEGDRDCEVSSQMTEIYLRVKKVAF